MALAPTAAAPPAPMLPPEGDPMADMPMDEEVVEETAGRVILTVMANEDGTWSMTKGDEPEPMAPTEGEPAAEPLSSPSQTFDNKGRLMKAILDTIDASDGGDESQAFSAAFKGEDPGVEKF